jgi:hypothetical protein
MATTEQIRIATPTEAERNLISSLTPEERRDLLAQGALAKKRRDDAQLLEEYKERIRSRQLAPAGVDPENRPYATNGKRFYYPNENEPMTSLGRMPGYLDTHVLQKEDGTIVFIADEDLRPWPTDQERVHHQQFQGELDGIREQEPWLQDS